MKADRDRACLQAAVDYLSLSPAEAAEWARRLDEPRLLQMREAARGCLRERLHDLEPDIMKWHRQYSGATPVTLEMTKHYEALCANAKQIDNGAAKTEVAKLQRSMEAALKVMQAGLEVAARPKLDKAREMAARDEARMILDGSDDPVGTMVRLAQRDDELGAVVASTWGRSYLQAKRVDNADEVAAMVGRVASASAVESADPARKAAGEALAAFEPTLGGGSTSYLVRNTLDEAAAAAQALGVPPTRD